MLLLLFLSETWLVLSHSAQWAQKQRMHRRQ
jgi:hypothetical protein